MYSFFFQAEDGIRDSSVTGVQTCALPISRIAALALQFERALQVIRSDLAAVQQDFADAHMARRIVAGYGFGIRRKQIGRASCREGGEELGVGGWEKKEQRAGEEDVYEKLG